MSWVTRRFCAGATLKDIFIIFIFDCTGSSSLHMSLVVASGGFSTAAVHGFSVQWLVLWSTGSGPTGFSAEERGFSRRGMLA